MPLRTWSTPLLLTTSKFFSSTRSRRAMDFQELFLTYDRITGTTTMPSTARLVVPVPTLPAAPAMRTPKTEPATTLSLSAR